MSMLDYRFPPYRAIKKCPRTQLSNFSFSITACMVKQRDVKVVYFSKVVFIFDLVLVFIAKILKFGFPKSPTRNKFFFQIAVLQNVSFGLKKISLGHFSGLSHYSPPPPQLSRQITYSPQIMVIIP